MENAPDKISAKNVIKDVTVWYLKTTKCGCVNTMMKDLGDHKKITEEYE